MSAQPAPAHTPARTLIHDELLARLPEGYQVEAYAPQLDGVQRPTILVRLGPIRPEPRAGKHARVYAATVLAVHPKADTTLATSLEVDALAEDVLHAIDLSRILTWSAAERVVVDDTWAGWAVEITTAPFAPVPEEGPTP